MQLCTSPTWTAARSTQTFSETRAPTAGTPEGSTAGGGFHCDSGHFPRWALGPHTVPYLPLAGVPQALPLWFPPLGNVVMVMPPHGGVCVA